jgi:molybdenum cofactor cytidylyltransferase
LDNSYTTVILASGLSERMGEPKALLKWDTTTTFLEKIINEYLKASCSRIICLINKKAEPFFQKSKIQSEVKFINNEYPEWGRFYAIKIALQQAQANNFCFIQNVDNPFVTVEIIEKLFSTRSSDAWCSPVYMGKGGHPVLLPQLIVQKISQIKDNNYTLLDILKPLKRINVEIDNDLILRNINTPEEYERFFNCIKKLY